MEKPRTIAGVFRHQRPYGENIRSENLRPWSVRLFNVYYENLRNFFYRSEFRGTVQSRRSFFVISGSGRRPEILLTKFRKSL